MSQPVSIDAAIDVHGDRPGPQISRHVYGSFAEHLGRGIYDGIWVGEQSSIPNTRGLRNDVIAALRNLKLPLLRWPGGCFADEYHWRDGIGPRAQRPRRPNGSWGGIETNAFGVHEFMDLVELIGAEPYVNVNVGSGTPREMMEWLEYMTSGGDTTLARLRAEHGRALPWKLRFVGIGNEAWGCGGNMRPEQYADELRRYAAFVRRHGDEAFTRIAVGPCDDDYTWTEVLMQRAAKHMDGLSLHYYTLPTGDWASKGSATEFGDAEWRATLARTLRMDRLIVNHSAIMDKYDPDRRIALVVDEWGTWYDAEPGTSALYQRSTLRDALVAALNLNIFNQHAERVRMAASAQAVNVLQALLLTHQAELVLTPTYHAFEMYSVHQDAISLPVDVAAPEYGAGGDAVPSLHASASRDARGVVHLSIVNLDAQRGAEVTLALHGLSATGIGGRVLTAARVNAANDAAGGAVSPKPVRAVQVTAGGTRVSLPSKSITTLRIE